MDKLAPVEAPLSIVVALIGRPTEFPAPYEELNTVPGARWAVGLQRSPDLDRPYASLPKVSLEADRDVSLDEVLTRAANELGEDNGSPRLHGFRLFEPRLAEGFPPDEPSGEPDRVSFVDTEGRLWWRGVNELDLPYSWLINATDAGLVAGDPFRPYLMLGGRGSLRHGLGPVSWQELHELLNALEPWLGRTADVGGSAVVLAWLARGLRRLAAGFRVADDHHPDWERRGAMPDDVFALVEQLADVEEERRAVQLQLLLGCSREEAGVLSRLVPSARSAQHEDDMANATAAYLRTLLFEHRDADPARAVARAIETARSGLSDDASLETPKTPDDFDWSWPERS